MFVLPGTDLTGFIEEHSSSSASSNEPVHIHVGPGIIQTSNKIMALRAGLVKASQRGHKYTLTGFHSKRYLPTQNDLVIGIITARLAEAFRVDIGGPQIATLPLLSGFEGATKKTRPNWQPGTIIFARVSLAHPHLEPELACFDPSGNVSADLFGDLEEEPTNNSGASNTVASSSPSSTTSTSNTSAPSTKPKKFNQLLRTTCSFSKSLQNPSAVPLLSILGRRWAFEVAAGANGRVFLSTSSASQTSLLAGIIAKAARDNLSPTEIELLVKDIQ